MKGKELLVTTALEETWGADEDIVFLGEHCKNYKRKDFWIKRKSRTLVDHWRDRDKHTKDHQYLYELYEKVLIVLSNELNEIHNTDKPVRYWRIIIGPWLLTYIPVIWDRWESVRIALLDENIQLSIALDKQHRNIPNGSRDALNLYFDHVWNHQLFCSIIDLLKSPEFCLNLIPVKISENYISEKPAVPRLKLQHRFLKFIDKCIGFLVKKNYKIVFVNSYFHPVPFIKLSFMLKQIPRLHSEFDRVNDFPDTIEQYRLRSCGFTALTNFEEFLSRELYRDMPVAYLEGYCGLVSQAISLPEAKVIFTANSHFNNELFKNWCAGKVIQGSKLVISEHGGAMSPKFSSFNHEEKISDIKTVWAVEFHIKQKRLPPNKLIGKKVFDSSDSFGEAITIIGFEMPLYSYRCESAAGSSLVLDDIEQKRRFLVGLDNSVYENVKVRPCPNRGWHIRERYSDKFGEKILSTFNKMDEDFTNSKILVCSYPQTTFSEAMISGIPTILLYIEQHWEVRPEFSKLIDVCKQAKIIHTDPVKAADHINSIYSNPSLWWNEDATLAARKMFFDVCGTVGENPLQVWKDFILEVLEDE
jgi:putative transferase (TIGR04331 family)